MPVECEPLHTSTLITPTCDRPASVNWRPFTQLVIFKKAAGVRLPPVQRHSLSGIVPGGGLSCSSPSSITRRSSSIASRDRTALMLDVDSSGLSNWRQSSRMFSRACRFFEPIQAETIASVALGSS